MEQNGITRGKQVAERRKQHRQRIFKGAKLNPVGMNQVYDCVARDLSESGARIRIPSPQLLPARFLFSLNDGLSGKPAKVTWIHGEELGMEFNQS